MAFSPTVASTQVTISALPQVISVVFPFQSSADLIVYDGGAANTALDPYATLLLGSDYTVSGGGYDVNGDLQTGTITVDAGGAGDVQVGDVVTIVRATTVNQTTTFYGNALTPQSINAAFDKAAMISGQLTFGQTRSMRAPPNEDVDWQLPGVTARAESFPFFDTNGNLTVYSLADIIAAVSSGGGTAAANTVYAGPVSGSPATPSFRALTAADLTGITGFASAGDVTASGLTMTTARILGRTTAGTGAIQELTAGTSLSLSAGSLNTIQGIQTTDAPTFLGVTSTRASGYNYIMNTGSKAFGFAINGTTLLLDDITAGLTRMAIDGSGGVFLPAYTSNGFVKTAGGAGGLTIDTATYAPGALGQLNGTTTNDSAAAGKVGEFISASVGTGSAISISSGVASNVTSISLTAGDWDVWGKAGFIFAATTAATALAAWITSSSASFPGGGPTATIFQIPIAAAAGNLVDLVVQPLRVSLSSTTTYYIETSASFTTSTMTAYGNIYARRRR